MPVDLAEKTERYESLLDAAIEATEPAVAADTPLADAAATFEEMARSYLEDGRHFRAEGDDANALAAFAYGHAWLDAGTRVGLFTVPPEDDPFAA